MAKTRGSVVGNHCRVVAISLGQMRHLVPSSSSAYRSVSYGPCFAVELDEPNVTLTNYQVARMWTTRKDTPAPPCHYEAGGGGIRLPPVIAYPWLATPPASVRSFKPT